MNALLGTIIVSCLYVVVTTGEKIEETVDRSSKLSIFQVVKFANSECTGSSKNGTCFTSAECSSIGGSPSGSCADGFGVCCIVTITSGQTASTNNSYLSLTSDITTGAHKYTVCPCSDDICRIKFDFIDFTLVGPYSGLGTRVKNTDATGLLATYANTGQCGTDTFQIRSPSGRSSPLICGENANQHMILEACGSECLEVYVGIGGSTSSTRKFNIRVMQYRCGDEQGGPPGCLQYYQNTSGKIRSFNFPDTTGGTPITGDYAIHLANQHYKTCIRRENGKEVICWVPCTSNNGEDSTIAGSVVTDQPSFGLSVSPNAASKSATDTECTSDYIWIPFGDVQSNFDTEESRQDKVVVSSTFSNRFCGRNFQTATDKAYAAAISVCSYAVPFELGVDFDDAEFCTADEDPTNCEPFVLATEAGNGGGILGFSLCYVQHTPPI